MLARRTAGPALALSLICIACGHDDAEDPSLGPGPILAGSTMVTPSLDGSWVITSTPAASDCGALNVLFATEAVLTITQAGNAIEFALADACGRPIPGGEGRVDPDRVVELGSEASRGLTSTCTLTVEQVRTGTVDSPPDVFSGTDVLTISGSDDPAADDCDPSLPCVVSGTFTATRCPRSGCAVACAP